MPPRLKFLRLRGSCSEKDLELIDKSIQFAESNQIDVVSISDTEEVKQLIADSTNVDQSIYVCMPFEGKIFDKLKTKGYRIIGPQCIISCLLLEMAVPKCTYPVCNISMLNAVVCCSSMKKEERTNIQQLVLKMGGQVTGDFTLAVTHLVAKEVGSKKYEVACSNNIPAVTPSWIHTAWEQSQYNHFVATESNIIKEHLIPIFKGCTICVTGIDATKRDAIKTIVQKNGGIYSGELNMKTCTHLLVEHPQGQKYNHARQWKLHCVSPEWLYESLKRKHWISEKKYIVEPDPDSTSSNRSILQQSKIQNTILGANTSRLSVAEKSGKSTNNETKGKNSKLKIKVVPAQSIDISNVKMNQNNCYLEECKIHLSNKPGPILDLCKKIINNGAGIRSNTLNESITHIVVWDQIPNELNTYLIAIKENNGMFPHVVSPTWLIDCCKNGKMMLEEDYSLLENSANETVVDDAVFAKPKLPIGKPKQTSTQLHMQFEDEISDENTLLDQYLNHESTRISQMGEAPKGRPNLDDITQGDETTMMDGSILERKKFAIDRFADDQVMQVKNLISEYGGEVVDNFKKCEFIIVPLTQKEVIPDNPKEVTLCWLEQSIENQKLQDPDSSFLYKPIHLPDNVKPLQNCVITISQYTGIERQHLLHLAELLGGVGQEYFVRNDTVTMKASTHLILMKPEGSKYDASIKWKIPCVGREWLFRCAKTKRKLTEGAFSMSKKQGSEEVIMLDEEEEEEEEKEAVQTKDERPRPEITVEETNAHAWEKKNEKNFDPDITIEETNAHAWEKKENVPAEKSIIAQAPNDITGDITIELSTRGASLMDGTSNTQIRNPNANQNSAPAISHDVDTPEIDVNDETAPMQMSINQGDGGEDVNNKSPSSNRIEPEYDEPIELDVKTPKLKNDFSAFNAIIAHEKRKSIGSANKMDISSTRSPMVSSSMPPDMDKSNFSFDFTDALDAFPSPVVGSQDSRRKSRRSRVSLPLDVQFTEALQRAVDKHCVNEDEEVFVKGTKGQKEPEEEEEEGVFQGVVVAISKKLLHRQSELHGLTVNLGGEIRYLLDNSCTHFVHQGKMSDTTKDFLEAKKKKKYLVSPHWLKACSDANERLDEKNYPVTFNPRMAIEVTSPKPINPKAQEKSPPVPPGSPEKTNVKSLKKSAEVGFPSPKEVADVQKKMQDIMNAAKAPPKNERRTRRQTANLSSNKTDTSCTRKMRNRSSSQKNESASSSCSDAGANGIDVINEQSQGGFITYDDPTARLERERILEHLKRASPSQDIESLCYPVGKLLTSENDNKIDENAEKEKDPKKSLSPYKPQISLPITNASAQPESIDLLYDKEAEDELKKIENAKNYKFIFSGMNAQEKIDYGGTIEELGGTLFDVQYFNTQASHLIVKAPTKNEKYLASLASGKWALHKSFLDASREANDFVNELDHEWGSQSNSNELALAARRWRTELSEKRKTEPNIVGAFDGWVVLLCIEASKQPGFKRILEAGGAKLLSVRPPFDNIHGATHAFIGDRRQLAKAKVDLRVLHDAGVWILKPEYIADYLVNHPKPSTFEYVLDDVKTFDEEQPSEINTTQRKRKASEAPKVQKKAKR